MTGEIQAEGLALAGKPHRLAPFGQRGSTAHRRRVRVALAREPEQIVLPRLVGPRVLVAKLHGGAQALHERRAVLAQAVEAPGSQQGFQHAPVDLLQVQAPAQILEAAIRAAGLALRDQRLDGPRAYAAYRPEPVAHAACVAGDKLVVGTVDIRWVHLEIQVPALLDE